LLPALKTALERSAAVAHHRTRQQGNLNGDGMEAVVIPSPVDPFLHNTRQKSIPNDIHRPSCVPLKSIAVMPCLEEFALLAIITFVF
jgi:hypothetical protein